MLLIDTYKQISKMILQQYVDQKQEEHLHLEFKSVNRANLSHDDDKRNFAKALSGFANSDGGIVVWGVDSRKNDNQIDCAQTLTPIDNGKLFLIRLNALTGQYVSPNVSGVMHKFIPDNNSSEEKGFCISFIPASDAGPHMAKAGEDRYYKRSGDSFYRMEHFDIQDMFGKRQKPKLCVHFILKAHSGNNDYEELHLQIHNKGRASAKHTSLLFELPSDVSIIKTTNLNKLSDINNGRPIFGWNDSINVFHPDSKLTNIGFVLIKRKSKLNGLQIKSDICCEHMPMESTTLMVRA